ncbi:MAG: hypothetical protein ACKV2Q_14830 [Planctomycetaceae bacterium]
MARSDKPLTADVTDWHRLFGIVLTKLFEGSAWEVVRELDLSIKQQRLDIVIVRRCRGRTTPILPDGFGPLADHNLITYKSLHEPLDGWALKELAGHSVNYRKQFSPSLDQLLPEESFRMYAIATRFPEKLAGQISLLPVGQGVYDVAWGTDAIRLLVLKQIPAEDRNTILNLFSADQERIVAGVSRYRADSHDSSSVLTALLKNYLGDSDMPQTLAEMIRDTEKRVLADIPASLIVEEWSLEKLQETKALIERRLAESATKKKSVSSRAIKGRRKTKTSRD